jgi:hypothetical protein
MILELMQYSPPVYQSTTGGGSVTSPSEWANLAQSLGPTMFLAVFCLAALIAFIVLLGYAAYKYGGKLFDRLDKFLETVEETSKLNSKAISSQAEVCGVARRNIINVCEVTHDFADIAGKFGKSFGVDVVDNCERIHSKMRTIVDVQAIKE